MVSSPQGVEGNEIVDGWAKLAAEEPDRYGVEWLRHSDNERRSMPLPASLALLKRCISNKSGRRPTSGPSPAQRSAGSMSGASKRPRIPRPREHRTDRCSVLPAEIWPSPHGDRHEEEQEARGRPVLVVLPVQADPGALIQALLPWRSLQKAMWALAAKETKRRK